MASEDTVVGPSARGRGASSDEPSSVRTDPPPKIDSVHSVAAGSVLAGKYRVSHVIGKGGMGLVVEARHLQLDTRVAIKLLFPEMMSYAEATERFLREARAASRLESRHVARVLDVGTLDSGEPFIVMECLVGDDLATYARGHAPLPIEDAVDYIVQACDAIAEAHEIGIVHRDVKPANLFLVKKPDGEHEVKVLDFGISKVLGDGGGHERDVGLTQTTTILGSALYMSPEQMQSAKKVDHRTDVYALGVCLFELVSGELPYFAETFPELCAKVYTEPPRSLSALRPEVPEGFVRVVERAIAHEADKRFPRVAELVHALGPYARPETVRRIDAILRRHAPTLLHEKPKREARMPARPSSSEPRRARGRSFALVALAATGLGALFFALFVAQNGAPELVRELFGATPAVSAPAAIAPDAPKPSAAVEPPQAAASAPSASASGSTVPAVAVELPDAAVAVEAGSGVDARADAGPVAHATPTSAAVVASAAPRASQHPKAAAPPKAITTSSPTQAAGPAHVAPASGAPPPAEVPLAAPPVDTSSLSVAHCFANLPDGTRKEVPCP